jgi:ABC-type dipeptide/oligopeptide/nickel transport system permease component
LKKYILKRLLQLIPIIIGLTFIVFSLLYISPGDPAQKKLTAQGIAVSEEVLEKTREEMGLNKPFLVQYADWFSGAIRGDLGTSYKDGTQVSSKLMKGMANTAVLSLCSLLLSLAVSVPLGIFTAVKRNHVIDYLIRFLTFVGNAMPNFLISVLLMYLLCIKVKVFPVIAKGSPAGLFLPSLTLAIPLISRFTRQIRAQVLEELGKQYVIGARSRGIKEKYILFGNVLHNAMIPIITIIGLSVGGLLGGSVVVESIFMWPGIGKLAMDSITARDYPTIQGVVILMAAVYVIINLITDIAYRCLDPRIGEREADDI